jgi:hypothetical protein
MSAIKFYAALDLVDDNRISNVGDPLDPQDVATKTYVDTSIADVGGGGSPNLDGGTPDSTYGGIAVLDAGGA